MIKLCYGVILSTNALSGSLGLEAFSKNPKNCSFCGKSTHKEHNFCPNCGVELKRNLDDIGETEVIEVLLRRVDDKDSYSLMNQLKIVFLSVKGNIAICKVLAEGNDLAIFDRPMQYFSWTPVEKAIRDFLRTIDIGAEADLKMFCLTEKG